MNIRQLIESATESQPKETYLYYGNSAVTFEEFNRIINMVANALLDSGIRKGDKICLMLANCPEFLYAWLGANKIGAIMVPINTGLTGEAAKYIIDHSDSRILFVGKEYLGAVNEIRGGCSKLEKVIYVSESATAGTILFNDFIKDSSAMLGPIDIDDEEVAGIIYTSGTTGNPKGVMQSHRSYVTTGMGYASPHWMGCTSSDRIMVILPLFHANAEFYSVMGSLAAKIPLIIIQGGFSASRFWNQAREYKGTVVNIIGPIEKYLMSQPPTDKDADNPVRVMWGPFDSEGHIFKKRFNVVCIGGYSLSESPLGFVDPLDEVTKRGDSYDIVRCMGYPVLYRHPDPSLRTRARIVDDDDRDCPDGTVGELLLQSTALMSGYYKEPEKTEETLKGGWLHTGDNVVKNEKDGLCYFVDRKKDIIRVKGENISSQEVETVLNNHPKVMESACIPVPTGYGDDFMKACIVLKEGQTVAAEELIDWCRERLAAFKIPRFIEFRDSLPKTPTMKIQKNILKGEKTDPAHCYDSWKVDK